MDCSGACREGKGVSEQKQLSRRGGRAEVYRQGVGKCGVRGMVLVHLMVACEWFLPAKA